MDAQDLSHKPVEAVVAAEPWKAKRQMSEEYQRKTDAFLRSGGKIEVVPIMAVRDVKIMYNNQQLLTSEKNQRSANKRKLDHLDSWEAARDAGRPTFPGMKCVECSTYERWTLNKSCMKCKPDDPALKGSYTKQRAREAKAKADLEGKPTYNGGKICTRCGSDERKIENSHCVKCKR